MTNDATYYFFNPYHDEKGRFTTGAHKQDKKAKSKRNRSRVNPAYGGPREDPYYRYDPEVHGREPEDDSLLTAKNLALLGAVGAGAFYVGNALSKPPQGELPTSGEAAALLPQPPPVSIQTPVRPEKVKVEWPDESQLTDLQRRRWNERFSMLIRQYGGFSDREKISRYNQMVRFADAGELAKGLSQRAGKVRSDSRVKLVKGTVPEEDLKLFLSELKKLNQQNDGAAQKALTLLTLYQSKSTTRNREPVNINEKIRSELGILSDYLRSGDGTTAIQDIDSTKDIITKLVTDGLDNYGVIDNHKKSIKNDLLDPLMNTLNTVRASINTKNIRKITNANEGLAQLIALAESEPVREYYGGVSLHKVPTDNIHPSVAEVYKTIEYTEILAKNVDLDKGTVVGYLFSPPGISRTDDNRWGFRLDDDPAGVLYGGHLTRRQAARLVEAVLQRKISKNQLKTWLGDKRSTKKEIEDFFAVIDSSQEAKNELSPEKRASAAAARSYAESEKKISGGSFLELRAKKPESNKVIVDAITAELSKKDSILSKVSPVAVGSSEVQLGLLNINLANEDHILFSSGNVVLGAIDRKHIKVDGNSHNLATAFINSYAEKLYSQLNLPVEVAKSIKENIKNGNISLDDNGEISVKDLCELINKDAKYVISDDPKKENENKLKSLVSLAGTVAGVVNLSSPMHEFSLRPSSEDGLRIQLVTEKVGYSGPKDIFTWATNGLKGTDPENMSRVTHFSGFRFVVSDSKGNSMPATPEQISRGIDLFIAHFDPDSGKLKALTEKEKARMGISRVDIEKMKQMSGEELETYFDSEYAEKMRRGLSIAKEDEIKFSVEESHRKAKLTAILEGIQSKSPVWEVSGTYPDMAIGPLVIRSKRNAEGKPISDIALNGNKLQDLDESSPEALSKSITDAIEAAHQAYGNGVDHKFIKAFSKALSDNFETPGPNSVAYRGNALQNIPNVRDIVGSLVGKEFRPGSSSDTAIAVNLHKIGELLSLYSYYTLDLEGTGKEKSYTTLSVVMANPKDLEAGLAAAVPHVAPEFPLGGLKNPVEPDDRRIATTFLVGIKDIKKDKVVYMHNPAEAASLMVQALQDATFLRWLSERNEEIKPLMYDKPTSPIVPLSEFAAGEVYYFFNPYHDEKGRFTSGPKKASKAVKNKKKKQTVSASYYSTPYDYDDPNFTYYTGEHRYNLTPRQNREDEDEDTVDSLLVLGGVLMLAAGGYAVWKSADQKQLVDGPDAGRTDIKGRIDRASGGVFEEEGGIARYGEFIEPKDSYEKEQLKKLGGKEGIVEEVNPENVSKLVDNRSDATKVGEKYINIATNIMSSLPPGHVAGLTAIRFGNPGDPKYWEAPSFKDAIFNRQAYLSEKSAKHMFAHPPGSDLGDHMYVRVAAVYSSNNQTVYVHDRPYDRKLTDEELGLAIVNAANKKDSKLKDELIKKYLNKYEKDIIDVQRKAEEKADKAGKSEEEIKRLGEKAKKEHVAKLLDEVNKFWIDTPTMVHETLYSVGRHVHSKLTTTNKHQLYSVFQDTPITALPSRLASVDATTYFAECYAFYVTQPQSLRHSNIAMYEFLKNNVFFGIEYTSPVNVQQRAVEDLLKEGRKVEQ